MLRAISKTENRSFQLLICWAPGQLEHCLKAKKFRHSTLLLPAKKYVSFNEPAAAAIGHKSTNSRQNHFFQKKTLGPGGDYVGRQVFLIADGTLWLAKSYKKAWSTGHLIGSLVRGVCFINTFVFFLKKRKTESFRCQQKFQQQKSKRCDLSFVRAVSPKSTTTQQGEKITNAGLTSGCY